MVNDIKQKILKLKKEKNVTILAHAYQSEDILEIADYTGDSFQLSVMAQKDKNSTIIMCGVHFMAETCKILSPEKKVILAAKGAGCPMAEQFSPADVEKYKAANPDCTVVCYINTTAELKAVCDVCVTSASALKICRKIENKNILFIPDINLGSYVAESLPEKNIILMQGGCPVHNAVTGEEAENAKKEYPNAELLVHPECIPDVVKFADYVGSTTAIMDYAKKSEKNEFIIGTELSIVEHLQFACPDKKFYPLSKKLICHDMKLTTLMDVYNSLTGNGGYEIIMSDELIKKASVCINKMLELG
jgi:quinolinate synthase